MTFEGVDLPVMYVLMGILIFLALMAALGAWVRGGGLKREDAEDLFNTLQQRNVDEYQRVEKALEETRRETAAIQNRQQDELQTRLQELESIVARVAREHGETLSSGMESVGRMISDSERKTGQHVESVLNNLSSLDKQVRQAGDQMSASLNELVRQQREQKAQSTIQLCEALITSLGTLKSSIATQLSESSVRQTIESDEVEANREDLPLAAAAPAQWPATEETTDSEDTIEPAPIENSPVGDGLAEAPAEKTLAENEGEDPSLPPWAKAFGADLDKHPDTEQEYPLPEDSENGHDTKK